MFPPTYDREPPREFTIIPAEGKLEPKSEVRVQVDLCSNTVKKYESSLVVDLENVGDNVGSLPMTARCVVPQVTVLTPILDYGRCFLRHPYEHYAKLQNETDLPAKYDLLSQSVYSDTPILFTSPKPRVSVHFNVDCCRCALYSLLIRVPLLPQGIVEAHSICDLPIIITPQKLEEQCTLANILIFGSSDAPWCLTVLWIASSWLIKM